MQRSRSAPLHDGWRSHVWLLNITPYVPRHKHQSTTPLSLPYLQLVEIVDTPLDPCTILPTRKWISARFRHIHLDLGVHITALAGISRCIAGDMRQDMLPSSRSEPKPSEQWNRIPRKECPESEQRPLTTSRDAPFEAHIASSVLPCPVLQCLISVAREPHPRSASSTSLNNATHVLANIEEPLCAPSSCTVVSVARCFILSFLQSCTRPWLLLVSKRTARIHKKSPCRTPW